MDLQSAPVLLFSFSSTLVMELFKTEHLAQSIGEVYEPVFTRALRHMFLVDELTKICRPMTCRLNFRPVGRKML